jgi:hypothetical protein
MKTNALVIGNPVALPILAKADDALPDSFVWMPAGRHDLSAHTLDGPSFTGAIICDEQAFRAVAASFSEITGAGQRVWLDENHDDAGATAWVKAFSWDPSRGILANVDWTTTGEDALRGKRYFSFSPAFIADAKSGRVLGLIAGHAAGGLVNAPAFGAAMPALIAARLGGATSAHKNPPPGGNPETNRNMNKDIMIKLLAALNVTAPADATEETLVSLIAKHFNASNSNAEVVALKAKLDAAEKAAKETAETVALQAKDARTVQEGLRRELDETKAVVAAVQAARVTVGDPDIVDVLGAYAAKDPCHIKAHRENAVPRAELARERARIFARDVKPFIKKHGLLELMRLTGQKEESIVKVIARSIKVQASNSLGTLSGSLIAQQSLSLLKAKLPALGVFTTDFSMENAKLNQSIITRVRGIPTVQTYNTSTGYAASAVSDTDVAVTITDHRYVQFAYNANELASTNRDLFNEQAEGSLYALGKDFVDAVLALFTAGNYYTTPGSPSANDGNGGHTIVTSSNWGRTALINARTALVTRHVYPDKDKGFAIQNPTYFGALAQDPALVSLAVFDPDFKDVILSGVLPPISGITPIEYADFPGNSINLTAVVGTSGCAVIAARLPYDYVDAQIGSNYGAVSQVTDEDTGLSVMLTQYVNHDLGVSNYRVAIMKGQAVGDSTRAQLITSA